MVIRTTRYIDINDLPKEVRQAYNDFVCMSGIPNGQHRLWEVGEEDSVASSYISQEKCTLVDDALRNLGLKDGEEIDLVLSW